MLHAWMDGRMVEEHRRDLMSSGPAPAGWHGEVGARIDEGAVADQVGAAMAAAAAAPAPALAVAPLGTGLRRSNPESESARRPLGHHVGALLIRAGTRLGGASIRTS